MKEGKRAPSSIQKAFDVMNIFTRESPVLTLEQISEKTLIPKTTAFRILSQLEDNGYILKQDQAGKVFYSLGYAFLEKGQMVKEQMNIRELAREHMISLRNELNLTIQLAIRNRENAVYIEQFESWRPIRVFPSIGKQVPLYSAACPRVLLAFTDSVERDWLLNQYSYERFTEHTTVDPKRLADLLLEIRESGFSTSRGELHEGTFAIAVPLIDPASGEVLAALSAIGMESDFDGDYAKYIDVLKKAAEDIFRK